MMYMLLHLLSVSVCSMTHAITEQAVLPTNAFLFSKHMLYHKVLLSHQTQMLLMTIDG